MNYGDDYGSLQQYLQNLYNVDPNKDNSAQNDFYGYQNGNSYNGQTYGSAYAGGTNGSAYGGWTASNPLSGNNAFSGNQGSAGYGPDANTGYDPRMGMKDGGSHNDTHGGGPESLGWNLSAPMQEVGGMPADTTAGGTIPTNGAMGPMRPGSQMPQTPGALQSPYQDQITTQTKYGPQDTSTPADRLITNSIGGQSSISAYDGRNGGRPFDINDEGYNASPNGQTVASDAQSTYEQKMSSMQDYMKAHGIGYFGDPQKDYGYSGNSMVPNTGGGMANSMEIPTQTAYNGNGHSDWTEDGQAPMPKHLMNAPPAPQFNPNAPTIQPFGGGTNADEYDTYSKHALKSGQPLMSPEAFRNYQSTINNSFAQNQQQRYHGGDANVEHSPATPGAKGDPTNDPKNYKDGLYTGPARPGMESVTAPPEVNFKDLQQQRKGMQVQPGQTIAPFGGTPISSKFQDPSKLIAYNPSDSSSIFDEQSTPYKPGKSQADPVLDGLLQQLQETHDPATINKIMKMINPSGSKANNLKGMA